MKQGMRAFTLIELLVVIAIIGILSAVILAALNVSRERAEDAKMVTSLRELEKALETYYSQNGSYPSTGGSWYAGTTACSSGFGAGRSYTGASGYIPNLAPTYIQVLPEVPKVSSSHCFIYRTSAAGTDYKLMIWQSINNFNASSPLADPGSGTYNASTGGCSAAGRTNTYVIYKNEVTPSAKCY